MKIITHEGQEYILKSEVDGIVRERLSKVAEGKRMAEGKVSELEAQLETMNEKVKGVDAMASQLSQLQDELAVSNQRYERHSAIASHGITDPEIRDLIEWQYTKAMDGKSQKDKKSLSEWISGMGESGEIPTVLQPYFRITEEGQEQAPAQGQAPAQTQAPAPSPSSNPMAQRPTSNQGVAQTQDHSTSADMWKRAGSDFEFYQQNRAQLKKQYYEMRNNRFKQ
jgi:hypothetical protein|tara:strand:+ start:3526 stop:4197 length:672 start_codon:yes stop_codon:yes gene_type:complete